MRALALALLLAAAAAGLAIAVSAPAAAAVASTPDLTVTLGVSGGSLTRLVESDVFLEVTVVNSGNGSAPPFVVDVWASQGTWGRQSLGFPGLAPGANVTVSTTVPFRLQWNGLVLFHAEADPAGAAGDVNLDDNSATLGLQFVSYETLDVGGRLASSTPLDVGDFLAFKIELRDGESILFQADTREGASRIDEYLVDEENWGNFLDALKNASAEVTYFADFSFTNTSHVSFQTAPLPAGSYYLILDNAATLQHGVQPTNETTVTYSVARLSSGIPLEVVFLVIAVGAAAVVATVRWRPSFESTEAVLSVPAPELGLLSPEDEPDAGAEGMSEHAPRPPRN